MADKLKPLEEAFDLALKGDKGKPISTDAGRKILKTKKYLENYFDETGTTFNQLNTEKGAKKFWDWLTPKTNIRGESAANKNNADSIRNLINKAKPHSNAINVFQEKNVRQNILGLIPQEVGLVNKARAKDMTRYIEAINAAVMDLEQEAIDNPKTAWKSRSLKNYILMNTSTGIRQAPTANLITRHGFDKEMGTLFDVSKKSARAVRVDYELGEFHNAVLRDQAAIAERQDYKFTETNPKELGKIKKFNDIWPYDSKALSKQVQQHLKPFFRIHGVEWVAFNPETKKLEDFTKNFSTKMLRNQTARIAVAMFGLERARRFMGHGGGGTLEKSYLGAGDVTSKEMKALGSAGARIDTLADDLDRLWGSVFATGQGQHPKVLGDAIGIDLKNTNFTKDYVPTSQDKIQKATNYANTQSTKLDMEVKDVVKSLKKAGDVAKEGVEALQKPIPKTSADIKKARSKVIADEIKNALDEFSDEAIYERERAAARAERNQNIGHNIQEATPEEVDQAVKETGADIKTPSGKAKIVKVLGMIGKKLPVVGIAAGMWAASTTRSKTADEFAAIPIEEGKREGQLDFTNQILGALGYDTDEERQELRAKWQEAEGLPFAPMLMPPAEIIIPTQEERKEQLKHNRELADKLAEEEVY